MKSFLLPLSLCCAALTGCVGYGDTPVYGNSGWPVQGNSGFYGGTTYGGSTIYNTQPYSQGYSQPYIIDGTRGTRDRDGDGVRNRDDRYPDDARRY